MIVGPDGAMWFTQWGGAQAALGRITTDGVYSRFPLTDGAVLKGGVTVGPDGALWFTEFTRSRVGRFDIHSGTFAFFDLDPKTQPAAIISFSGSLWIGDVFTNILYRMSTAGAIQNKFSVGFGITDFAIDNNALWMGGGNFNLIARLNRDEQGVTILRLQYQASRLAFDSLGNLWIADSNGGEHASLHRLDPQQNSTDYPIPARYGAPGAIALGPDDQIWFIESRFAESPSFPGAADNIIGRALTGAPIRTKPVSVPCRSPQPFIVRYSPRSSSFLTP